MKWFNIFFLFLFYFSRVLWSGDKKSSFSSFDFESQRLKPLKIKSAIPKQNKSITKLVQKKEQGQIGIPEKDLIELRRVVFQAPFDYEKNRELYDKYPQILPLYFLRYTNRLNLWEYTIERNKLPITFTRVDETIGKETHNIEIFEDIISHYKTIKIPSPLSDFSFVNGICKKYSNIERVIVYNLGSIMTHAMGLMNINIPKINYNGWKHKRIILQQQLGKDSGGFSLLHEMIRQQNKEMIVKLRKNNVDPNVQDDEGKTALYVACTTGYIDGVEELLKFKNIDLEVSQKDGWICFETIILDDKISNRYPIIRLLLEHGANPNKTSNSLNKLVENNSLLGQACQQEDFKTVNLLIKYGALINTKDLVGVTPFKTAVFNYKKNQMSAIKIVKLLLKNNANPNIQDHITRSTPLHVACEEENYNLVKFLLKNKANPNIISDKGTPLYIVCEKQNYDIVELLIEYGADALLVNRVTRKTPLDIAQQKNDKKLIDILSKGTLKSTNKEIKTEKASFLEPKQSTFLPIETAQIQYAIKEVIPHQYHEKFLWTLTRPNLPSEGPFRTELVAPWYRKYKKQLTAVVLTLLSSIGIFGLLKYLQHKKNVKK